MRRRRHVVRPNGDADMRTSTDLGPSRGRWALTSGWLVQRRSSPLMRSRNSMVDGGHLNTAAREVLDLSAAERIAHIRHPRWIGYTRAKQLLNKLDDLLTHPKTHRMPNLLIIGDTNAGNTMLEALGAPYTPRAHVAQKQVQVLRILKQIGLRMLIIDEVQNILTGPV